MSLKDGEYELDVSQLFDTANTNNLALRYGFMPDSMDQSKPLKLYQMDNECVLTVKASDGDDIIFEGIPQRHKAQDSYYLEFTDNTARLKKLDSTIRLSKTRNAKKLQIKMNQWDEEASNQGTGDANRLEKEQIERNKQKEKERDIQRKREAQKQKEKQEEILKQIARKERDKKVEAKRELEKKEAKRELDRKRAKEQANKPSVATKRPPTANNTANNTPNIEKEPIINDSDFDDLDLGDFEDQFPVINIDDDTQEKVEPKSVPKNRSNKKSKHPAKKASLDMDIDDDFKDLEDQLAEVLEEEKVPPKKSTFAKEPMHLDIDSDESDFENYQFSSIKIDDGSSAKHKANFAKSTPASKRPVSLRNLAGNDDISSEEE